MEKEIKELIPLDLATFLNVGNSNGIIDIDTALEIGSYVAANYLRIIFTKNKEVLPSELNGVFGLISDFYHTYFENQLTEDDFMAMSKKSLELLQDTSFDEKSKQFFNRILHAK